MAETPPDAVQWATQEAARLRNLDWDSSDYPTAAQAVPALEFLRTHAGPRNAFFTRAEALSASSDDPDQLTLQVADILDGWVRYRESGLVLDVPFEVRVRIEASTDLLEQAQSLLDTREPPIHPAAPIALAGAALEEFLRSLVEANEAQVRRPPSISAYAEALVRDGILSRQDGKDITAWAGLRNDAAHGHFENLSVEQARLMLAHVNLFIRRKSPQT